MLLLLQQNSIFKERNERMKRVNLGCVVLSDKRKDGTFKVHSIKRKTDYILKTEPSAYIPFKKGDVIRCCCDYDGEETFHLIKLIQTELGQDRISVISCLMRSLPNSGMSGKKAELIFQHASNLLKTDQYKEFKGVGYLLSHLANIHIKSFDKITNTSVASDILRKVLHVVNGRGVPCLTILQVDQLFRWWIDNTDMRRLYCMGLNFEEIKVCCMSPLDLYEAILTNPYGIPQLTMEKCKDLDERNGREMNDYDIELGTFSRRIYSNSLNRGYTCTKITSIKGFDMTDEKRELLTKEFRIAFSTLREYKDDDQEVKEVEVAYVLPCFEAEEGMANFIEKLVKDKPYFDYGDALFPDDKLDEIQRSAVNMALRENFSIIYGPAGSGKTTTIKTLLDNLAMRNISYVVTSFTGKAVRRACEANGIGDRAATMHRILYGSGPTDFEVLVIDESSMVDLCLIWAFCLRFINRKFKIVLIGDPNQLLPISWGNFFVSCIDSRVIPRTKLECVYRSSNKDGSMDGIIHNAKRMINYPYGKTFAFEEASNVKTYISTYTSIKDVLLEYKTKGYKQDDVTIICPYRNLNVDGEKYKYLELLNNFCQMVWHNNDPYIVDRLGKKWCLGDRVSMTENVNPLELSNGQEGTVIALNNDSIHVAFNRRVILKQDEALNIQPSEFLVSHKEIESHYINETTHRVHYQTVVKFPFATEEKKRKVKKSLEKIDDDDVRDIDTSIISLSYAVTIHGSQGSEWKVIIFQMPNSAKSTGGFLNRNMMYVGFTRASEEIVLIDQMMKIQESITKKAPYRCEMLSNRLRDRLPILYPYEEKVLEKVTEDVEYCDEDYDFLY